MTDESSSGLRAERGPADPPCSNCGERNPAGSQFCSTCQAYLAWSVEEPVGPLEEDGEHAPELPASTSAGAHAVDSAGVDQLRPTTQESPASAGAAPANPVPPDPGSGKLRLAGDQLDVTVPVNGEPADLTVRVTNTSSRVDGYDAILLEAPEWLAIECDQVQLLPGTEEELSLRLRITAGALVPAQQLRLVLRIRSLSQAPAHADLPLLVTVPVVDVPVGLRAEPRLLRVRDRDNAECAIVVDNSGSNRPVQVRFFGSDPELAVAFRFEPAVLEIGPDVSAAVKLVVTAPVPEPGQEVVRPLTVTAWDGTRNVETALSLHQSTSARVEDPLPGVEVEPSVLRFRDSTVVTAQVTLDNGGGTQWAHLKLSASDPERVVRVAWSQPLVHVPPGRAVTVGVRFEAPLPDVGAEVTRAVTLIAADGRRTSKTTATLVQSRSASPMATLALRVEPSVVRVRDADTTVVQVHLDNRRGQSPVRLSLAGSDPERAVRFGFAAPVVVVGAGQVQTVPLHLGCAPPEPGQEMTRQLTVSATDGDRTVEAVGSLIQASSPAAMELLALRLDPSVLRLTNRGGGSVSALVDNRRGAQPVRVSVHGDDPENVIRFKVVPPVVDVPPGGIARATVALRAPRAPAGQEVTRPFVLEASDGRLTARAEGSLVQASTERRPLARILFTLLGALAMFLGAFGVWDSPSETRGTQLDADTLLGPFGVDLDSGLPEQLVGLQSLLTLGLVVAALAVLVAFGLTAPSGRLSRVAAFLGLLVVLSPFVAFALFGSSLLPGLGAVLVVLGCVAGYIGGALGRR